MILVQGLDSIGFQVALNDFAMSHRDQIINARTFSMVDDELCFNFGCESLDMTMDQWSNTGSVAFELSPKEHSFAVSFEDIGIRFSPLELDLSLNLIERNPTVSKRHLGGQLQPFMNGVAPTLTMDSDATIDMYYVDSEEIGKLVFSGSWDEFKNRNLWLDCVLSEATPEQSKALNMLKALMTKATRALNEALKGRFFLTLAVIFTLASMCSNNAAFAGAVSKKDLGTVAGITQCSATFISGENIPSGHGYGQKVVYAGSRFNVRLINVLILKGKCVDDFTTGGRNTFVLGGTHGYWVDRQTNQISRHDNALGLHSPGQDRLASQMFGGSPDVRMLILSGDLFFGVQARGNDWQINAFIRETGVPRTEAIKMVEAKRPVLSLSYSPQMERSGGTLAIATKVRKNLVAIHTYHVTRSN
jgi:hypothetical protein